MHEFIISLMHTPVVLLLLLLLLVYATPTPIPFLLLLPLLPPRVPLHQTLERLAEKSERANSICFHVESCQSSRNTADKVQREMEVIPAREGGRKETRSRGDGAALPAVFVYYTGPGPHSLLIPDCPSGRRFWLCPRRPRLVALPRLASRDPTSRIKGLHYLSSDKQKRP